MQVQKDVLNYYKAQNRELLYDEFSFKEYLDETKLNESRNIDNMTVTRMHLQTKNKLAKITAEGNASNLIGIWPHSHQAKGQLLNFI